MNDDKQGLINLLGMLQRFSDRWDRLDNDKQHQVNEACGEIMAKLNAISNAEAEEGR